MYGEKRISVEGPNEGEKIEYRVWNPFRSKLAASVLAGVDNIHIKPGSKVLYLGAASGTSVSHVSDIVGPDGVVYAVEFSHRSGESLPTVSLADITSVLLLAIPEDSHVALGRSCLRRVCADSHIFCCIKCWSRVVCKMSWICLWWRALVPTW